MIGLCQYHLSDGTRYCKSDVLALRIPHIMIDLNRNQLQSRTINTPRWSISSFPRLSSFACVAYIVGVRLSLGLQQLYRCTWTKVLCPAAKQNWFLKGSASSVGVQNKVYDCHLNILIMSYECNSISTFWFGFRCDQCNNMIKTSETPKYLFNAFELLLTNFTAKSEPFVKVVDGLYWQRGYKLQHIRTMPLSESVLGTTAICYFQSSQVHPNIVTSFFLHKYLIIE